MTNNSIIIGGLSIPLKLLAPPRSWAGRVFNHAVLFPAALLTMTLVLLFGSLKEPLHWFLFSLANLELWLLIGVLAHECGHLAAAWVMDCYIHAIGVGPIALVRKNAGWRLALGFILPAAGYVLAMPRTPREYQRQFAVVVAAGPFMSIVVGLSAIIVALSMPLTPTMWRILTGFGGWSLYMGVVSCIPFSLKGLQSDGRRALGLFRGDAATDQLASGMHIQYLAMSGQRPRDWDAIHLMRANQVPNHALLDAGAALYAYYHHMDRGDWATAGQLIERAANSALTLPPMLAAEYIAEYAYYQARQGRDLSQCRSALERLRRCQVERQILLRLEAAILLAEGDRAGAGRQAAAALARIDQAFSPGIAQAERDWLLEIIREANSPLSLDLVAAG